MNYNKKLEKREEYAYSYGQHSHANTHALSKAGRDQATINSRSDLKNRELTDKFRKELANQSTENLTEQLQKLTQKKFLTGEESSKFNALMSLIINNYNQNKGSLANSEQLSQMTLPPVCDMPSFAKPEIPGRHSIKANHHGNGKKNEGIQITSNIEQAYYKLCNAIQSQDKKAIEEAHSDFLNTLQKGKERLAKIKMNGSGNLGKHYKDWLNR